MKIELLNGFTRVNPKNTANVYNLEGRHRARKRKKRRLMRSLSPENRERMQMRAQRMQARKKQMPLTSIASDKASRRARMEERARVGTRRMTSQQMLRGFDANYTLKDNAIYSDTELLQFPGAGLLARRLMKGKKSKSIPRVATRGAVNPITGQTIEQQAPLRGKAKRQARREYFHIVPNVAVVDNISETQYVSPRNQGQIIGVAVSVVVPLLDAGNYPANEQNFTFVDILADGVEIIKNVSTSYYNMSNGRDYYLQPMCINPGATFTIRTRTALANTTTFNVYLSLYFDN